MYLNLYFHFCALVSRLSAALCSATQHEIPPEFGRKWGTECLKTRFPLPAVCGIQREADNKKQKFNNMYWLYLAMTLLMRHNL